ncbi:MAG: hypothetical protein GX433_15070 [Deltaproteobacteria bacterium]|jgi:hypothetical protein|nr:hypothetical protein [Deltaproteobacteria bacterium]
MKRAYLFVNIVAAMILLVCSFVFAAEQQVDVNVQPNNIKIDALYNGTSLTVTGNIPAESDVIARFIGTPSDLHMKEKGKVFGLLWMNLDSLTFKNVPNVCIVCTPKDMTDPVSPGNSELERLQLAGLKNDVKVESAAGVPLKDDGNNVEELLKLKKQEGLYRDLKQEIFYGPVSNGMKAFKTEIPIPSRLSPGKYTVEVAAVDNGEILGRAVESVNVELVGFPAFLSHLAFGSGAIYGVLATIIAILGGLAIGMVFQSKGAH